MTAAVGLALAPAPDFVHFLPFLQPLLTANFIASGIATILVPAVAATIFISLGLATINCKFSYNLKPTVPQEIQQGLPKFTVLSQYPQIKFWPSRSPSMC